MGTVNMQSEPSGHGKARMTGLALAALGVVYGDIGTSPLYAVKECFDVKKYALPVNHDTILGVFSLILWTMTLLVAVKYLWFVLRADNKGEGGILALLSLAFPERRTSLSQGPREKRGGLAGILVVAGVAGACLLYGDGILTPAVTVVGAVEGLTIATHAFEPWVVPISVAVLIGLFAAQRAGTAMVGRVFGPVTLVWFLSIAALGIYGIRLAPEIVGAINPWYGLKLCLQYKLKCLVLLGSVVLVVTGAEALYADMGHFGIKPIRWAWYLVVFPALVLNYLGQGALLLAHPELPQAHDFNPFYMLCPKWSLYPMVILATMAAVIASQALISGAYSLTMQAIQLGYMPRLTIEHTSEQERGQIYMPQVNWLLMVACIGLVLAFRTSTALADAYGVAVTITMVTTTLLFFFASRRVLGWSTLQAGLVTTGALSIELPLMAGNLMKIPHGGWFTLAVALAIFAVMATWKRGRAVVWERIRSGSMPLEKFIAEMERREPVRVAGTAVYMAGNAEAAPLALLHNLKHNKVLHRRVVILTIAVEESPRVADADRIEVEKLDASFWRVRAHYGFFEEPDVGNILKRCAEHDLEFKPMETTFFLSRETVIAGSRSGGMMGWRKRLFSLLSRNATGATAYFRLPVNRVVELGMQVEI